MSGLLARALVSVLVTVVAALLVRALLVRYVPERAVQDAQPAADRTTEALAGLYGVLVAFMLGGAWDRIDDLRTTIMLEATALAEVVQIAGELSPDVAAPVVSAARAYQAGELDDGAALRADRGADGAIRLSVIWRTIAGFQPAGSYQTEMKERAFDAVQEVARYRRIRLGSVPGGLHPLIWVMLLGGGAALLLLIAISRPRSFVTSIYLAMLAMVLSFALFAVHALSNPAASGIAVQVARSLPPVTTM